MNLRKLDLICLFIVIMVSVVCGYWAVTIGIKKQKQIRQENEVLSKRLKDLDLAEANLQQLKQALDSTRRELQALNERIPETSEMGKFLRQLDYFLKARNIVLVTLQPLPSVKEKLYSKLPVRLMIKGSFLNIYRLLRDLETMNRTLVMERIVINKALKGKECQVELIANLFQR